PRPPALPDARHLRLGRGGEQHGLPRCRGGDRERRPERACPDDHGRRPLLHRRPRRPARSRRAVAAESPTGGLTVGNKTITAYVVQRLGWEYGDDWYYRDEDGDAPVLTFLDRSRAEAHARECQWRHVCNEQINAFGYANAFSYADMGLQERTSLP